MHTASKRILAVGLACSLLSPSVSAAGGIFSPLATRGFSGVSAQNMPFNENALQAAVVFGTLAPLVYGAIHPRQLIHTVLTVMPLAIFATAFGAKLKGWTFSGRRWVAAYDTHQEQVTHNNSIELTSEQHAAIRTFYISIYLYKSYLPSDIDSVVVIDDPRKAAMVSRSIPDQSTGLEYWFNQLQFLIHDVLLSSDPPFTHILVPLHLIPSPRTLSSEAYRRRLSQLLEEVLAVSERPRPPVQTDPSSGSGSAAGTFPILMWLYNGLARIHPFIGYILAPVALELWIARSIMAHTVPDIPIWGQTLSMLMWWHFLHLLPPWRHYRALIRKQGHEAWRYINEKLVLGAWDRNLVFTSGVTMAAAYVLTGVPQRPSVWIAAAFAISHVIFLGVHYGRYMYRLEFREWMLIKQYLEGLLPETGALREPFPTVRFDLKNLVLANRLNRNLNPIFEDLEIDLAGRVIPWFVLPEELLYRFNAALANPSGAPETRTVAMKVIAQFNVPDEERQEWGWRQVGNFLQPEIRGRFDLANKEIQYIPVELRPSTDEIAMVFSDLQRLGSSSLPVHMEESVTFLSAQLQDVRRRWDKPDWSIIPKDIQTILDLFLNSSRIEEYRFALHLSELFKNPPRQFGHRRPPPPTQGINNPPSRGTPPEGGLNNDRQLRTAA